MKRSWLSIPFYLNATKSHFEIVQHSLKLDIMNPGSFFQIETGFWNLKHFEIGELCSKSLYKDQKQKVRALLFSKQHHEIELCYTMHRKILDGQLAKCNGFRLAKIGFHIDARLVSLLANKAETKKNTKTSIRDQFVDREYFQVAGGVSFRMKLKDFSGNC